MKHAETRPFADPEKAARKMLGANATERRRTAHRDYQRPVETLRPLVSFWAWYQLGRAAVPLAVAAEIRSCANIVGAVSLPAIGDIVTARRYRNGTVIVVAVVVIAVARSIAVTVVVIVG